MGRVFSQVAYDNFSVGMFGQPVLYKVVAEGAGVALIAKKTAVDL